MQPSAAVLTVLSLRLRDHRHTDAILSTDIFQLSAFGAVGGIVAIKAGDPPEAFLWARREIVLRDRTTTVHDVEMIVNAEIVFHHPFLAFTCTTLNSQSVSRYCSL